VRIQYLGNIELFCSESFKCGEKGEKLGETLATIVQVMWNNPNITVQKPAGILRRRIKKSPRLSLAPGF
jgi:hypothetical protein